MEYGLVMSQLYFDPNATIAKEQVEMGKLHDATISRLSHLESTTTASRHNKWKEFENISTARENSRISRRLCKSLRRSVPRSMSTLSQWHHYFMTLTLKNDLILKQPFLNMRKDILVNIMSKRQISNASGPSKALCYSQSVPNLSEYKSNGQSDSPPKLDANTLIDEYLALDSSGTIDVALMIEAHLKFNDKLLNPLMNSAGSIPNAEEQFLKDILKLSWRKTTALKEHLELSPLVSDLKSFAKVITEMLSKFQDSHIKSGITTKSKLYFDKMEEKIQEAKQCVTNHVATIADQVETQLAILEKSALNEFNGYSDAAKIKATFRWLVIILKVVGALADLCTPFGVTVGTGKSVKIGVTAVAVLVSVLDPTVENPRAFQSNFVDNQAMLLEDTKIVLDRQIGTLQKAVQGNNDKLSCIQRHLDELIKIDQVFKKEDLSENEKHESLKRLDLVRDAIYSDIQRIKVLHKEDEKIGYALDTLYLQLVMAEKESILYSRSRSQWNEVFARIFRASKEHKRYISERTESFSHKCTPMMNKVVSLTKAHIEDVAGESAAKMIISEWKLETILKGVKRHLESLVKGMRVELILSSCLNRLMLAIQKHLELIKLIRQYEDTILQAEFIESILVPQEEPEGNGIGFAFKNRKLKMKRDKAECLTNMSLLLLEVDKCIHSFNLLVFPTAHVYIKEIRFQRNNIVKASKDLGNQNIGEIAKKCVKLVNYLAEKLNKHFCEIRRDDRYWKRAYFSNDYKSTGAFCTWTCKSHGLEINKLLLGEKVILIADVNQYPEGKAAIKYNGSIRFRIVHEKRDDHKLQNELYEYLRHFSMTFETGDYCDYRLLGSLYRMEVGNGLVFEHSMEKCRDNVNANVGENMVLRKLEEYMLSPFTCWTVQLRKISSSEDITFKFLHEKFANCVNVELEGWGMFIDEVCAACKDFEEAKEVYSNLLMSECECTDL